MGDQIYLILFVASLIGSAFFSGMEQAYLSSNRLRIEVERTRGSLRGRVNAIYYRNQSTMIAMMLLGNNISLVIYGITFGHLLLGESKVLWGIENEVLVLVIQTILSTLLVLIGAEFFSKSNRINQSQSIFEPRNFSIAHCILHFILTNAVYLVLKFIAPQGHRLQNEIF